VTTSAFSFTLNFVLTLGIFTPDGKNNNMLRQFRASDTPMHYTYWNR